MKKIRIAVIGLGFGHSFAEIYANHPQVEKVVVVDKKQDRVDHFLNNSQRLNETVVYNDFDEVIRDKSIDAVHVCTGIDSHADLTVKALEAGKHCACAVPMATTLEEIQAIVNAVRKTSKKYMMMETVLYGANFLMAYDMLKNGEYGKVQHMRGIHYQAMDDGYWNTELTAPYWNGLPPMHYSTHAVAPLRVIADSRIESVVCLGTGTMSEKLVSNYGNPYPIEDALLSFENNLKGEVVRGLFECSACETESFNIYGSKKTFMSEYGSKVIEKSYCETKYDKAKYVVEDVTLKNYYKRLPKELYPFTICMDGIGKNENYMDYLETAPLSSHSGSHPHLCNEFVKCIVEDRESPVNEIISANITAAGVCAHMSAMKNGEKIIVPEF